MKVDFSKIIALYKIEMRMILRDRRSMFMSILLPVLVMPLMMFSSNYTAKKQKATIENTVYLYSVTGSNAAFAHDVIAESRKNLENNSAPSNRFIFHETNCPSPLSALTNGEIHFVVEGLMPKDILADVTNHVAGPVKRIGVAPGINIYYRANQVESTSGMHKITAAIEATRQSQRTETLKAKGFQVQPGALMPVSFENVASQSQVAGLSMGRWLTGLFLFFVVMGGMVVATDLLAGEKERGTLETLLTTSVSHLDITTAKLLAILTVAMCITLIQSANLMAYACFKFLPLPPHFSEALPPQNILLLFVLFIPIALLASSILLLTSGYAKTYKEAQLYFIPVFLLLLLPTLVSLLPGLTLRSAIVIVPIANLALAVREILVGTYDWPMIAIAWIVTLFAALLSARLTMQLLSQEKRITASETDRVDYMGGPALFTRQAPRWFAVMWGLLLIISNQAPHMDLRIQLVINLIVIFLGGAFLMMRHYKLSPREALALRMPKPITFFAVLIGVPGGMLTGVGLYRLANVFFPVPEKILEEFSATLIPPGMGLFQIILLMAVLPGIVEEVLFRGLLLHSLRQRLHPAMLVIVVGLVFGFFHMAVFRLAPTAFLGMVLACVTLLTGSIYPAMLWHALNNASALISDTQSALIHLDSSQYLAGPVLLACSFWILWKNRTPYPGIRPWRRPAPACKNPTS